MAHDLCLGAARYWLASSMAVRNLVINGPLIPSVIEAVVAVNALEEKGLTKSDARARMLGRVSAGRASPSAVKG